MAHLTKPAKYDIQDTNIALLGSDLEKRVREHAGDIEPAWNLAGKQIGTQIWRIEKFKVVSWNKQGQFYDGDSYIVLHTYKKTPESKSLSYDLHFWLGQETTQDEAATAAYKTVELDDHLNGTPVQYREVQGYESARFLSYFPQFVTSSGGISTGFHHVSQEQPDLTLQHLYHISAPSTSQTIIRQVPPTSQILSTYPSDVFILHRVGHHEIWQYNTKTSSPVKERAKAAEFVSKLRSEEAERKGEDIKLRVFDEGGAGAWEFIGALESTTSPAAALAAPVTGAHPLPISLLRLSDASGNLIFELVKTRPTLSDFKSSDVFILDTSPSAVYVWIGKSSSGLEKKLAVGYAQKYLWEKGASGMIKTPIVRLNEGNESEEFLRVVSIT